MKIKLIRDDLNPTCTLGKLYIDGVYECETLEDVVRSDGVKIFGETAIPHGLYRLDVTFSPRFKRDLPLLVNVSGFVGVRIHPGNTAKDTEGCILVGRRRDIRTILQSKMAFDPLFEKIMKASKVKENITLEIINA